MKQKLSILVVSILSIVAFCAAPLRVVADVQPSDVVIEPTLLLSEFQTGLPTSQGGGSREFIELANVSGGPIDLTGWFVWYVPATQSADIDHPDADNIVALQRAEGDTIVSADGHYLLSGSTQYLNDPSTFQPTADQFYASTLAATGGHLRLLAPPIKSVACG